MKQADLQLKELQMELTGMLLYTALMSLLDHAECCHQNMSTLEKPNICSGIDLSAPIGRAEATHGARYRPRFR